MSQTIDSFLDLQDLLDDFKQDVQDHDYGPLFTQGENCFDRILRRDHEKRFNDEKSPTGESWPKLHPITIARKGHDTILVDTGELFMSLADEYRSSIREYNPQSMRWGTRREWAWTHQQGSGVPQRMHTGASDDAADKIANAAADYLVGMLTDRIEGRVH